MEKYNTRYIRNLSKEKLRDEISILRNELIRENAKSAIGNVSENPRLILNLKRKISKIMTIINENKSKKN